MDDGRAPDGRFAKGWKGGPGRALGSCNKDILEARRLSSIEVQEIIFRFMEKTQEEVIKIIRDVNTSVKEALIASIIGKAIAEGDMLRTQFLLVKMFGEEYKEAKKHIKELKAAHDNPDFLKEIPTDKLVHLLKEMKKESDSNG